MIDLWDVTAVLAVVVLAGAWATRRFYRGNGGSLGCGGGCCKNPRAGKCD
ncbi:FeoB-associated Cys-rich membrane protein [Magnetospirillum sp. SS-4]|jgi:hypothetical protein